MKQYQEEYDMLQKAFKATSIYGIEIYRFLLSANHVIVYEDPRVKTIATDCKNTIFYNLDFLRKLSMSELVYGLVHEVYHCILNHISRLNKRDHTIWNMACDYYINDKLIKDNIGTQIKGTLYSKKFEKMSADQIYRVLISQRSNSLQHNFDDHLSADEAEEIFGDQIQEGNGEYSIGEMTEEVMAKGSLTGSSFFKDVSKTKIKPEIEPSKLSWNDLLKKHIKDYSKFNFSYSKLNKKNYGNIIFPKQVHHESLCNAIIAVDISGSVSSNMHRMFLSEILELLKGKHIFSLTVLYFDTRVVFEEKIKLTGSGKISRTAIKIAEQSNAGGGTDFKSVFDHLGKKNPNDYLIFFTDGYPGGSWGQDWKNLIYVIASNQVSPIGKTIHFQ